MIIKYYSIIYIFIIFVISLFDIEYPKIIFLPVGHGSCVIIKSKNNAVILDCGSDKYSNFIADKVLYTFYKENITNIKIIFVSHLHFDHISGINKISKYISVKKIIYSTNRYFHSKTKSQFIRYISKNKNGILAKKDNSYNFNNIKIRLFTNHIKSSYCENNSSLALKLKYKNISLLFCGDLENRGCNILKSIYKQRINSSILVWPHHGSTNIKDKFPFKIIQCKKSDIGYKIKKGIIIQKMALNLSLNSKLIKENIKKYINKTAIYKAKNLKQKMNKKRRKICVNIVQNNKNKDL